MCGRQGGYNAALFVPTSVRRESWLNFSWAYLLFSWHAFMKCPFFIAPERDDMAVTFTLREMTRPSSHVMSSHQTAIDLKFKCIFRHVNMRDNMLLMHEWNRNRAEHFFVALSHLADGQQCCGWRRGCITDCISALWWCLRMCNDCLPVAVGAKFTRVFWHFKVD